MNNAQLDILKAAILAETDPTFVALRQSGATGAMADWYNEPISPAQKAWVTNQPSTDSDDAPNYANFDAIAAGKRDSWGFFLASSRNFTRNKVRKWITDVWGNATSGSDAEAILLAATRNAQRGEIVFGGTTKSTGTVTALDLTFVGDITNNDILQALARP